MLIDIREDESVGDDIELEEKDCGDDGMIGVKVGGRS